VPSESLSQRLSDARDVEPEYAAKPNRGDLSVSDEAVDSRLADAQRLRELPSIDQSRHPEVIRSFRSDSISHDLLQDRSPAPTYARELSIWTPDEHGAKLRANVKTVRTTVARKKRSSRMAEAPQTLAGVWRRTLEVYNFEIRDEVPKQLQIMLPWAGGRGRYFIPRDFKISRASVPTRTYDPIAEAGAAFAGATSFDPEDEVALLEFVNQWGLLGVEDQEFFDYPVDAVERSSGELAELRELSDRLASISRASRAERVREWPLFANHLNGWLETLRIRPVLDFRDGRASQAWWPRHLRDVLWAHLWRVAGTVDQTLRTCEGCGGLFAVSLTNAAKRSCSVPCGSRVRWRRFRTRQDRR